MHQSGSDDLEKEQKFLLSSMEDVLELYLIMIATLLEVRSKEELFLDLSSKKHLATTEELDPNRKFVKNSVLNFLAHNKLLLAALEKKQNHQLEVK